MSYAIMVWRVDIEKLKSYHGCKDEARLEELLEDDDIAERIAEHDEEHEDEIEDGMPSLAQALRNIVMGETSYSAPEDPCGRHVLALEAGSLAELAASFAGAQMSKDGVEPILRQYKDWLAAAKAAKQGLVVTAY